MSDREESPTAEEDQNKDQTQEGEEKQEKKKKVKVSGWSAASPEPPKDKEEERREYFREELNRLQKGLKNEKAKIKAPPCKEYTPYIHNPLTPYFTTDTAEKVFNEKEVKKSYSSRPTAIGLCDPWVDHQMDVEILSQIDSKPAAPFKEIGLRKGDGKKYGGSTRLPKYPAVAVDTPDVANSKHLNYGDVPQLRKELREKTSSKSNNKMREDYKRTKDDFYRMDLDKLDEVHPLNRGHMKQAYFAYLQNTPGSKKAIKECVKEVEADENEENEDGENEDGENEDREENENNSEVQDSKDDEPADDKQEESKNEDDEEKEQKETKDKEEEE